MSTSAFLTGFQAAAEGVLRSGSGLVCGFPGTGVNEILRHCTNDGDPIVQWTPNEKVAVEVAFGAARAGMRAAAVMRHEGLMLAAESLAATAYSGIGAGLVIIAIDDPGMLSTLNEQDTRFFARSAKIPLLAPSDIQDAVDFVQAAFTLSEKHGFPFLVRLTTRLGFTSGSCSLPDTRTVQSKPNLAAFRPTDALARHEEIEKNLLALEEYGNQAFEVNSVDVGLPGVGIITGGIPYLYAKDLLPSATFLKLGLIHPLPKKLIQYFATLVEKVYVIEELEPFIEEQIRAMGIKVIGKDAFPRTGELNPDSIARGLGTDLAVPPPEFLPPLELPKRSASHCDGCNYKVLAEVFKDKGIVAVGDVGCFNPGDPSVGTSYAAETNFSIGAGLSIAYGMGLVSANGAGKKITVVAGSTFLHSGLPALAHLTQNSGNASVMILASPSHRKAVSLMRDVDYRKLCEGLGVGTIRTVNVFDADEVRNALDEVMQAKGVGVIIATAVERESGSLLPLA